MIIWKTYKLQIWKTILLNGFATTKDKEQLELLQAQNDIEMYEEMIANKSNMNIALMDSLFKSKIGELDMYLVAINLEKAVENPGSDYDIILQEGDVVTVPEYTSTVKSRGEVKYATAVDKAAAKRPICLIKQIFNTIFIIAPIIVT